MSPSNGSTGATTRHHAAPVAHRGQQPARGTVADADSLDSLMSDETESGEGLHYVAAMEAPQRVFTPGTGAAPPALTGREREQAVLKQCLADLLGGEAPPHDVALMGPRGNGKTVLLNWFDRACRETGRLEVARLLPSRIRSGQAVVDALLPVPAIRRILPRKLGVGHAEWAAPEPSAQDLTGRLTVRCRRRPVVTLVRRSAYARA